MDAVLLVFAKAPRPGHVKTRLTSVLSPETAAQLYEAFLYDALALYAELDVDVRLYLAPPRPDDGLDEVPGAVTLHTQRGEGLGERMQNAFREALTEYERAAVVGTDHPTLPRSFVQEALSVLASPSSICIGPSEDGGYYLLGMNAVYPQLFTDMTYSHDSVFTDTLARIGTTEARLTVLPRWYDVDTPADLKRMLDDLSQAHVPAPRTRAAVADLSLDSLLRTEGENGTS